MMKGAKSTVIYLLFGVLIIGILSSSNLWQRRGREGVINSAKAAPRDADLRLQKIDYMQTTEAIKQWGIEAETASYFREKDIISFRDIKVTCFSKARGRIILEGEEGRFDTRTQIISIHGQVIVSFEDGYQFRTDTLDFSPSENMITSSAPVRLVGPKLEVMGQGIKLNLVDETFKVGRVRSLLHDFNLREARIK
ncbi:MAG: LPS export ABC transporter periplasmic protein LptC [Deltaproteobacteria bacterium]|nr:MAG: LPS export ABC transporter periplasmic protein LptC [Deltaproteobacteria bacterium]